MNICAMSVEKEAIVLFDGECNLCNHSVQWILKNERKPLFKFCAMQSVAGQALLKQFGFEKMPETLVLFRDGHLKIQSDAVLAIAGNMNFKFRWISWFSFVPKAIRDSVYKWIAQNRIKWFGKADTCWLMRPEWKSRFMY